MKNHCITVEALLKQIRPNHPIQGANWDESGGKVLYSGSSDLGNKLLSGSSGNSPMGVCESSVGKRPGPVFDSEGL